MTFFKIYTTNVDVCTGTMSSSTASTVNKLGVNHKINVCIPEKLPPITYQRTVAGGRPTVGTFRVQAYWTENSTTFTLPVQKVNKFEEYIGGCIEHEKCLGHFCITPRGTILLPQKLASTLGIMSNSFAKMAESIYTRDSASQELIYRDKLRSLMLGKLGKMRGDMPSGVVDSSARQVISLCWQMPPNHIAIPRKAAANMKVLRTGKDKETGLPINQYIEDELKEDDWVIAVRPPSLWAGNVQPMRVVLWDHECFGLSPSNADEFHADHDGDEIQIYFLGKEASIEQCKKWKQLNKDKFQTAVETNELPDSFKETSMQYREEFMVHSTLSIKELMDGEELPSLAKAARVKEPMANMFIERLKNPNKVFKEFSSASIQGIRDVMAQQLNQGLLGDMSRQARLAASCIHYAGEGTFYIKTSSETIRVINTEISSINNDSRFPLGGNPCMRGISALCAVAQQSALDSHRVSQSVASKIDLIDNLIKGGKQSLVAFLPNTNIVAEWKYETKDATYCIINNESIKSKAISIIAAYSPIVLKTVERLNGNIKDVCKKGLIMVSNYYDVKLSSLELHSLVELFCYRAKAFDQPITTKNGLLARDMRWIVTIFANHYGKLKDLQRTGKTNRPVCPETITDASAFCNFDYM